MEHALLSKEMWTLSLAVTVISEKVVCFFFFFLVPSFLLSNLGYMLSCCPPGSKMEFSRFCLSFLSENLLSFLKLRLSQHMTLKSIFLLQTGLSKAFQQPCLNSLFAESSA